MSTEEEVIYPTPYICILKAEFQTVYQALKNTGADMKNLLLHQLLSVSFREIQPEIFGSWLLHTLSSSPVG